MRVIIVGPCPKCGNKNKTGHFIGGVMKNHNNVIKRFKNGERIKFYDLLDNRKLNCYCDNCGYKWYKPLKKQHITDQEFNNYLHEYGFYEERDYYKNKINHKEKTREEKAQSYNRKTTVLAYTTGIDLRKFNPYKD